MNTDISPEQSSIKSPSTNFIFFSFANSTNSSKYFKLLVKRLGSTQYISSDSPTIDNNLFNSILLSFAQRHIL